MLHLCGTPCVVFRPNYDLKRATRDYQQQQGYCCMQTLSFCWIADGKNVDQKLCTLFHRTFSNGKYMEATLPLHFDTHFS